MTVYNIFEIVGVAAFILGLLRFLVQRQPNICITFLRDFVGCFFIFSGFVKAVDPLGTSYKMHEYFEAFASEGFRPFWEYMAGFSTLMAILMIAAELFVGFVLLIGWKPRFTVGIIWLLTLFFTLLTGYTYLSGYCISKLFILLSTGVIVLFGLVTFPPKQSSRLTMLGIAVGALIALALFSKFSGHAFMCAFKEGGMKVTDCGCFGDFIKLKPWQTFYKDVLLDFLILILVLNTKHILPVFGAKANTAFAGIAGGVSLFLCLYCVYWNEPVIDFRPYAIGNDIADLRIEKKAPKIEMTFIYGNKNTGESKYFTYDDVLKGKVDPVQYDTLFERKDKVLDPGIPARILGLYINNDDGEITDSVLGNPDYSLMVVSWNLNKTSESAFKDLNALQTASEKAGIKFFALVTNDGHVDEFRHKNQTAWPFYYADETPIKTMMRSNPGLMLLKKGVIVNKWHYHHLPTFDELNKQYFSKK